MTNAIEKYERWQDRTRNVCENHFVRQTINPQAILQIDGTTRVSMIWTLESTLNSDYGES